ncbi:diguanylate cyclase domain-containing protein [Telmatospirillum sp.]|uniref:GGDEF domain-containing protein n=1 Tax=Telmatospirillum sp. TaxID=2079197 RepID=UPI00283D2300|nr:diguanylate cyclase [Telmatospirillum sp.]MDR3439514.1 diguanylate cyclase [Telmatospirillum sp.]
MVDRIDERTIEALGWSSLGGRQGSEFLRRRALPRTPEKRPVVDVSSVFDFSEAPLPLAVEQSLAALVEEVERLRHEVDLSHHYENFLGEEADRHSILPVLNRRAWLRALGQLLVASEQSDFPGSALYLHVGGVERLRVTQGLGASDAALVHVAELMRKAFRQTDLIGYLDGSDFAVALALAEPDAAREKARAVAESLAKESFIWRGSRFLFTVGFGLADFQPGVSAEDLLGAADASRRASRACHLK